MLMQLIALQVLTFIVLAITLKVLFSRHLDSALKRLKSLQEETITRENQLNEELEKAKKARAEEVERGKKEAKAMIEQAKKEVETLKSSAEDEAKQHGKKIFAHGQEELEKIKSKMVSDIEARALQMSTDLISYTFSQKSKDELRRYFLDELIDDIEAVDKSKFSVKTSKAKVLTSFPLNEKEKEKLKKVLSAKMGSSVTIAQETKPELITGLIIQLGALELDGSLKNRLYKALPLIRKKWADDAK